MKRWLTAIAVAALILAVCAVQNLAQGGQARLRVVQASPDAPPLDVAVDGNTTFPDLAYKDITDYTSVEAGSRTVTFVPTGGDQAPLIEIGVDLQADTDYTIVAVGTADSIEAVVLVDDNTPPAPGQARVRFMHASPDAPAVNVRVQSGPVLWSNVEFKGVGNYLSTNAGTVTLEVLDASTNQVVLTVPNTTLNACSVYSIYAVGLTSGEPPLEAITSTDATTTCAAPAAGATATPGSAATLVPTVRATSGAPVGTPGTPGATVTGTKTATKAPTKGTATKAPTKGTATKAPTKAPTKAAPTTAPTSGGGAPTTAPQTTAPQATVPSGGGSPQNP
ncbi:MAG: DUF4397 domain-containing protein [Anaerolineae bacterium]